MPINVQNTAMGHWKQLDSGEYQASHFTNIKCNRGRQRQWILRCQYTQMRQWTSVNICTAFTLCVYVLTYNIKYYNQDLCINNNSSYLGLPSHFKDSDVKHLPKTYIYCYVNYLLIPILQTKWFKDKRVFFFCKSLKNSKSKNIY